MKPKEVPESEVMKAIKNYFAYDKNVRIFRRNVGAMKKEGHVIHFGEAGQADYWGIVRHTTCPGCHRIVRTGVHLEIEAKKADGKVTALQWEWLKRSQEAGAITAIVIPRPTDEDPAGFSAVRATLEKIDKEVCPDCLRTDEGEALRWEAHIPFDKAWNKKSKAKGDARK